MILLPPALVARLASPAAKWLIGLGLVLAVFAGGFHVGKTYEKGENADDLLAEQEDYIAQVESRAAVDRAVSSEIASDLDEERAEHRKTKRAFERKLADVSRGTLTEITNEIKGDGVLAPVVRLSSIACGLWNDALAEGLTAAERAGWLAGEDPCTGTVEVQAALANLSQVAGLLGQCRAREQKTLVYFGRVGLTKEP